MSLSVINKYVTKKEKDILDYAKILESIITIDDNKMWKKKTEFGTYAKDIISIYSKYYYFVNNDHRDNPIEYSNDNINNVLKSIIEYCKVNDKSNYLTEWKNEIFLLSVIICTACYVDFATNVVDGNFLDTKGKFKYLLNYLSKTKILHIKENKYWINDLFDAIKKNTNDDQKFFDAILSDNYHNELVLLDERNYLVEFSYHIPGLDEFNENIVNSCLEEYENKFNDISFELLTFEVLKELISNRKMPNYLIKINRGMKRQSFIKAIDGDFIKDYVGVIVPWSDAGIYDSIITEMDTRGIRIVYEFDEELVDKKKLGNVKNILIDKKILENVKLDDYKDINFIIRNKED